MFLRSTMFFVGMLFAGTIGELGDNRRELSENDLALIDL